MSLSHWNYGGLRSRDNEAHNVAKLAMEGSLERLLSDLDRLETTFGSLSSASDFALASTVEEPIVKAFRGVLHERAIDDPLGRRPVGYFIRGPRTRSEGVR